MPTDSIVISSSDYALLMSYAVSEEPSVKLVLATTVLSKFNPVINTRSRHSKRFFPTYTGFVISKTTNEPIEVTFRLIKLNYDDTVIVEIVKNLYS